MKILATLTDGQTIEIYEDEINKFSGQIILGKLIERGIAPDQRTLCHLLNAHESSVRYGMVHPEIPIRRII